jgi:LmbE family N-acetylglucosaminyl deacetylase
MLRTLFNLTPKERLSVVCLGAHADDIEIGCGGTLLRFQREEPNLECRWVVFSANAQRRQEGLRSAGEFLRGAQRKVVRIEKFRESFFPGQYSAIKRKLEEIKRHCEPHLVFTHYRDDRHQDHRVLSDLAWNTFRHHLILEYEIPKYDGDLGSPNVFVPLDEETCQQKIGTIVRFFQTQKNKHWFTEDTFYALLRLRGIECCAKNKYAEAFYGRKLVL